MKTIYPLIMLKGKLRDADTAKDHNTNMIAPPVSFYKLHGILNSGTTYSFDGLANRKVLLVNTASDCGFTGQYDELQQLYTQYRGSLEIIGFPSNDFKNQEKGSDEEIAAFCKLNYGVTFPLMQKSKVTKGSGQNEVFKWLSDALLNGWSNQQPKWNFCKYLVNEQGILTHFFPSDVSPLSAAVTKQLKMQRVK
ncbi:glutathione peroxidase [Segetibacter sp. 3557_3]|uniref:glutathione peroxidase n=1 Tax=Segetibacter sp. 3557_3 TaxID=2547429 RepID=UPI001FB6AD82|nr:glutathione peroxidase [Segetibacter sp. 3557_3]